MGESQRRWPLVVRDFGTLGIPCQHSRHRIEKSTPVGSGRLPFFQEGFDRTSAIELQHHNSIWKGVCLKHLIFFGVGTHPNHRNTKLSCFPCSDFFCSLNQQEHVGQMRLTCLFRCVFFHSTCHVTVARCYVTAISSSFCSSSSSRSSSLDLWTSVLPARPQLRVLDPSVGRRTSTASCGSQQWPLDLNGLQCWRPYLSCEFWIRKTVRRCAR